MPTQRIASYLFDVLAHLGEIGLMIFIRRHLLRRSDGTPRCMAHARTALLFDPNMMSEL
jgi:hypothetical protein